MTANSCANLRTNDKIRVCADTHTLTTQVVLGRDRAPVVGWQSWVDIMRQTSKPYSVDDCSQLWSIRAVWSCERSGVKTWIAELSARLGCDDQEGRVLCQHCRGFASRTRAGAFADTCNLGISGGGNESEKVM